MNKPTIMELFDLVVLTDIEVTEWDEQNNKILEMKPIYGIGWTTDLDAGLYGSWISPSFDSQEKAIEWAKENPKKILQEINLPEEEYQQVLEYFDHE